MRNRIIAIVTLVALIMSGAAAPLFAVSGRQKLENIKVLESGMSDFEKTVVYEENRKSGVGGFLLNTAIGFGVGSFSQGDKLNGGIALGLDLAGAAIMGSSFAVRPRPTNFYNYEGQYYVDGLEVSESTYFREQDSYYSMIDASEALLITGIVVTCGSRIYQMITPWIYANSFNRDLKEAFHITDISVVPTVTKDGMIAPTAVVGMAF